MARLTIPGMALGSMRTMGIRMDRAGEHDWSGDVAAHAEHRRGRTAAQQGAATEDAGRKLKERLASLGESDALEAADFDPLDGEPGGGDESGFEAALSADEQDVVAASFAVRRRRRETGRHDHLSLLLP